MGETETERETERETESRVGRLPRWSRQEILVLIQGKRMAETKVRRVSGSGCGSGVVEPKWASVSSYCGMHGVNRGPVQCRKRWSNLAGDFKKIKEWESHHETSFWSMRNDLRRLRKLPGFFDKEVYDILDSAPIFDSRRPDHTIFSDDDHPPLPPPPPLSPGESYFSLYTNCNYRFMFLFASVKAPTPEEGRKRKREIEQEQEEEEEEEIEIEIEQRRRVMEVLEKSANALSASLDARKAHSDSLLSLLNKLADALLRISDKL